MKKLISILFIMVLLAGCSSDDEKNDDIIDDGEKIEVTADDIFGSWKYEDSKTGIIHFLHFYYQSDEPMGMHERYRNGNLESTNRFSYTITGLKIKVKGTTIQDNYETEIFKRENKLYFLDMPFSSYDVE